MGKLISKKHGAAYAKQSIILPEVGEVMFDENGAVEVADDKLEAVIAATVDSFDFRKDGESESVSDDEDAKGKKDDKPEFTEAEIAEWTQMIKGADTKTLLEMASELKLGKPAKIAAYTDDKLRAELLKKIIGGK